MRAILLLVGSCAIALVVAACGTTLGAKEEGLELLPGPPLAVEQPPEPSPPPEPLTPEELEVTPALDPLEPLEPGEPPFEPIETVDEVDAFNPFSEAVRLLLAERSVRIATTASNVIPGSGRRLNIRSDGIYELATFTGTIDVDAVNLPRALGSDAAVAASFIPSQMVFVDNRVFLDYGELAEASSAQAPWASARYRDLTGAAQWPDQGAVSSLALATPIHVAAMLTAARKTLVEVGRQPIRGASATHYQAVVDLSRLPAAAPESTQGLVRGQARQLAAARGTNDLPIDVWLDDRGRLRRVSIDLGAAATDPSAVESELPADATEPDSAADPAAAQPAPAEPAPEDAADPAGVTDPASVPEPALDSLTTSEEVARALEGGAGAEPGRPSAVLVIDFITFAGRAVAQAPAEAETGSYASVARLARAVAASLAG